MQKTIIAIALASIVIACQKEQPKSENEFQKLTETYYEDKNRLNPLEATSNGESKYHAALEFEMTQAHLDQVKKIYQSYATALTKIDRTSLSEEEKISYGIMQWETQLALEGLEFPSHYLPITQFTGTHLTMALYGSGNSAQPFEDVTDYRNYHRRLERFIKWLEHAKKAMQEGIQAKVTLPKVLTERLIAQFENLVPSRVEESLFYGALQQFPASMTDADKEELSLAYQHTIQHKLNPKLIDFIAFLKNDYLPNSAQADGLSQYPFGQAYYAHLVKQWTTTTATPDEIHALGLQEVARIRKEMEKVKTEVGFTGSLHAFFEHVRTKKELMPFTDPQQVLDNFHAIHQRMKPHVDQYFHLQPKTPFEIRRTEAFREATASAEYAPGDLKNNRAGVFYVPIPDVQSYNFYADENLFLHEAIPGHHFQIALQQENEALPAFRQKNWFGAAGEGWALYCESLGKEMGLYTDPYQYFGMLSSEMHRAIRLVVDTGIHHKGWTREQAIAYSLANEAESESSITAEIERYMAFPGQALSYKMGQLKILELRKKAETELGDSFSIKDFHATLLRPGLMPLAMMESLINEWIAKQKP